MDWRENDRKVNNRRAFSERSRGQTRTVRQARFVSVWARAGRTLDTCNNVQINPAPWWCSRASDQHTDPVVADHSSGPTDRWNIPLKLQVNPSFLWFFPLLCVVWGKTPACKRSREPLGSDQRNQGIQSAFSLCFNTLSSSYHSITNLPARPTSFFSLRRLAPPRVSTTFFLEINAGPVEAATKTVITQNAANSWVITAYFIRCARGSRRCPRKGSTYIPINSLNMEELVVIFKRGGCLSARWSVSNTSPVHERSKIC